MRILKCIRCCMGSQWRSWRMSVMCSLEQEWVSNLAARNILFRTQLPGLEEHIRGSRQGCCSSTVWILCGCEWGDGGTKTWTDVEAEEWRTDVLMCGLKDKVGSRMMPKFWTTVERVTVWPSSWVKEERNDLRPVIISDLSQLSLKLLFIRVLCQVRQSVGGKSGRSDGFCGYIQLVSSAHKWNWSPWHWAFGWFGIYSLVFFGKCNEICVKGRILTRDVQSHV